MSRDEQVEWVVLRTFDDPALARMTLDFLQDHDIPVQTRGDSPEGVRNLYSPFDIRVVVPASRLEEAREALAAFTAEPTPETPFRGPLPPPELGPEDAPATALRKKRGPFAFALAFLVPIGGGHFYAQHNAAGLVLALAFVGFVIAAMQGYAVFGVAAVCVIALDALASALLAVRRCNEQRIPSPNVQRLTALGLVAVAAAGASVWSYFLAPADAVGALLRRCETGDAAACLDAAQRYERDARDAEMARHYYARACSLGEPRACILAR